MANNFYAPGSVFVLLSMNEVAKLLASVDYEFNLAEGRPAHFVNLQSAMVSV